MRSIFLFLLLIVTCREWKSQKEMVHFINKLRTTWRANEYFRDTRALLGTYLDDPNPLPLKTEFKTKDEDLPKNYDLREAYPECASLKEIRDQANCGSCWAFGAAESMSDRICIKSGGKLQTRVSTQYITTCCYLCGFGCNGGYPSQAWSFWKRNGIPTGDLYGDKNTCLPYFLPPCDHHVHGSHGDCPETVDTPKCVETCQSGYPILFEDDKSYGSDAYSVSGEKNIMKEIYENGSVEGSFNVYNDFVTYKEGVYQHVTGSYLGGHAIKIIGWGETDDGVKYWICVNSWNDEWGDHGLFKILRGNNECNIEGSANAGNPVL